jgi:hypothetical protein
VVEVDEIADLEGDFLHSGRVDVEPPSVADSLCECVTMSPRAWQATVDVDVVDKVVKIFSVGCPSSPASNRNIFILVVHRSLITRRCILVQIDFLEGLTFFVASS